MAIASLWLSLYQGIGDGATSVQKKIAFDMLGEMIQSKNIGKDAVKYFCTWACKEHDLQLIKFLVDHKCEGIPPMDDMLIHILRSDVHESTEDTGELLQYMIDQGADPSKWSKMTRIHYIKLLSSTIKPVVREFIEKHVIPPMFTFFSKGSLYEYTYGEKTGIMTTLGPDGIVKTTVTVFNDSHQMINF